MKSNLHARLGWAIPKRKSKNRNETPCLVTGLSPAIGDGASSIPHSAPYKSASVEIESSDCTPPREDDSDTDAGVGSRGDSFSQRLSVQVEIFRKRRAGMVGAVLTPYAFPYPFRATVLLWVHISPTPEYRTSVVRTNPRESFPTGGEDDSASVPSKLPECLPDAKDMTCVL